jgi:hypothetical protein
MVIGMVPKKVMVSRMRRRGGIKQTVYDVRC